MTRGLSHSGEGTCSYLAVGYTGVRAFGVIAHYFHSRRTHGRHKRGAARYLHMPS